MGGLICPRNITQLEFDLTTISILPIVPSQKASSSKKTPVFDTMEMNDAASGGELTSSASGGLREEKS